MEDPDGYGASVVYNCGSLWPYHDVETGLNYNYNRDYDPPVERYVEADPTGLYGESYSLYAYVAGNPLIRYDQTGLGPCTINVQALVENAIAGTINPATGARRVSGGGNCAQTVRNDLVNAGGPRLPPLGAGGTPSPAAWGPTLINSGCFRVVTDPNYKPQPGDIAITVGNNTGHVSIFDGNTWDADIATRQAVPSSGANYAGAQPTIYQYIGPR